MMLSLLDGKIFVNQPWSDQLWLMSSDLDAKTYFMKFNNIPHNQYECKSPIKWLKFSQYHFRISIFEKKSVRFGV